MKKVKLILVVVVAMLFLGIGSVNAQEKKQQIVIVKVYEFVANSTSRIMVIDPTGTVTEIELKKMLSSGEQNIIPIQKEINKWADKGFVIKGISSGSVTSGLITTIILSKDE